ncbi:HEAT repeat domain-containing protein [Streptomyces sp. Li-HN-5-11]|uniref:HEAT repeat domain-containing protein n=1 Tax=Streptomyces sp. Li-HN-5-11 TaxID=3075432 RepID=UPI0028AF31E6|nr:HEAT repeat domain-containing protein [Streptomyces sp. Li-HN-5-11]WNM32633.1 HEAT repeat domain-containing protein [Streptomyces sp. Li-HN-5-11]
MFDGLHDIDWASMEHAYGTAEEVPALLRALRSPDAVERHKALDRFYGAVHHQGSVYPPTAASLPFLLELAADGATPERAAVVALLVSIGRESLERGFEDDGTEIEYYPPTGCVQAVAFLRERGAQFADLARDPDPDVRLAAIGGLGLFLDNADQATVMLRERLAAEQGTAARLRIVEAAATLALRVPAALQPVLDWLAGLATDPALGPVARLGALVQQTRCAPDDIGEDVVAAAVGLLRESARALPVRPIAPAPSRPAPPTEGVAPQIVAAFADLDHRTRVYAPTTALLRTFHEALGARVADRTAVLAEQLASLDPGSRLDAVRMSGELMRTWRGDHTRLLLLVADQLTTAHQEVAAEAAAVLASCHPIAAPARQTLATHIDAQRAVHGPNVWAAPDARLRRSHQEAVRALARLGDARALPSLLAALDSDMDAWRAIQVAGHLPQAADQLVPRLGGHLRRIDLSQQWMEMSANAILAALAALGDRAAVAAVVDTLGAAVRHEQHGVTRSALKALGAFGPAAVGAREVIRSLTTATDAHVRPAAVAALWAVGGDLAEVMPLLLGLLDDRITFRISDAADLLGEIGPPAFTALPRLRGLLTHDYEWVRVHCAAALWEIGGQAEAPAVLDALLQAMAKNPATANHVVACLDRMGSLAAPALPLLREQLALPRRGGRFKSVDHDEELQRVGRTLIARLDPPPSRAFAARTS